MSVDGSGLTRLTDALGQYSSAALSPDGRHIAFVAERNGQRDIYVMNIDGSEQTNLTNDPARDGSPEWSSRYPPPSISSSATEPFNRRLCRSRRAANAYHLNVGFRAMVMQEVDVFHPVQCPVDFHQERYAINRTGQRHLFGIAKRVASRPQTGSIWPSVALLRPKQAP